jgi:hypothetical protein
MIGFVIKEWPHEQNSSGHDFSLLLKWYFFLTQSSCDTILFQCEACHNLCPSPLSGQAVVGGMEKTFDVEITTTQATDSNIDYASKNGSGFVRTINSGNDPNTSQSGSLYEELLSKPIQGVSVCNFCNFLNILDSKKRIICGLSDTHPGYELSIVKYVCVLF